MEQTKTFKIKIPGLNFELICTNLRTVTLDEIKFWAFSVYVMFAHLNLFAVYPLALILAYCFPSVIPVQVLYVLWLVWDRNTPYRGGRKWKSSFFRDAKMFKAAKDYFPLRLVKTAELPTGQNYVLGLFPHGTIPVTPPLNFLTNANNIDDLFPGIDFRVVTINLTFQTAFLREMYLALGACSCSESSIKYLLNMPPSKGVMILPGGAAEASLTKPGSVYEILKSSRKGFIRMALQTGTSLVPVFTFGENEVFLKHKVNMPFFRKLFRLDFFLMTGRGFFQHHFGLLPRQKPVTSVVGKPIPVPKVEHPTQQLIDEYHEKFYSELYQLFEEYKHQYDNANGKSKLIML